MTKTFHRNLSDSLPTIVHASGVWLTDSNGKKILDAAGGALTISAGHCVPEILEQAMHSLKTLDYINGTHFQSDITEKFATRLARYALPLGHYRSLFLASGSEANEAAFKLARQVALARKEPQRTKVIASFPSYHGNTLGSLALSGRPNYQQPMAPFLFQTHFFPAFYAYHRPETPEEAENRFIRFTEALDPKTVLAWIIEPVGGSSTGASLPPPGVLKRLRNYCTENGIQVIADEVLCGSGRTGTFLASEKENFDADYITLGKGLHGGYSALSAVLIREEIALELTQKSPKLSHAQTLINSPALTAFGEAVWNYLDTRISFEDIRTRGERYLKRICESLKDYPHVANISGRGFLWGIEFSTKVSDRIATQARTHGITVWSNPGLIDNASGDLILLGPPLTLTEEEFEELLDRLVKTVSLESP